METGKNLHSHRIQSPISHRNEVSGHGDDGEGDQQDNWQIECIDQSTQLVERGNTTPVMGDTVFQLKHVETGQLLYCDRKYEYN